MRWRAGCLLGQITVAPGFDLPMLRKDLAALAQMHGVDLHVQHEALTRRVKRLVVFDMDSTLIRQECIDELARMAGKYEQVQVRNITGTWMPGAAPAIDAAGSVTR